MHVFASVDEADIGLIRDAQETEAAGHASPSTPTRRTLFEGTIYQIRKNSTTTQNVVTYPVVVAAPNPDLKLLPGMTASISFQIEARDDVLRVPNAALRFFPPPSTRPPRGPPLPRRRADRRPGRPRAAARCRPSEKADAGQRTASAARLGQDGELLRAVPVAMA